MKYIFLILLAIPLFSSCKKDPDIVTPPGGNTPLPETPVYVPIYLPGDTSLGAAYATKNSKTWRAQVVCKVQKHFDPNYVGISFLTYNQYGFLRESFGFFVVPKIEGTHSYGLQYALYANELFPGNVSTSYHTTQDDGDVEEDAYRIDTTATDNYLRIDKLDWENKRIEGRFTASFNIVEPRINAVNPKKVKFTNGRFSAVIQE